MDVGTKDPGMMTMVLGSFSDRRAGVTAGGLETQAACAKPRGP